jgi:GTPase SAR1 family protein
MRPLLKVVYVFHSVVQPLVSVKEFLDGVSDETLSASEKRKLIISELDREKTFRIMACGATGHGKSTLLNGIVGRQIFKPGHSPASKVDEYTERLENSSIVVLNTPDFDDTRNTEREYLQEIQAKCKEVDTLLYCVSMTESRITPATKKQLSSTVSKLKKVLSSKIWKSCVVALTFANQVLSRFEDDREIGNEGVETEVKFNSIVDEWKSEIQNIFSTANISNYKEIPIVATGKVKEPKLLPDDDKTWLSILWNTIYNKSPADGKVVLFHFNAVRLSDCDVSSAEDSANPIHEQKIEVDEPFKRKLWDTIKRNLAAVRAMVNVASATIIGATIGVLAIGIPLFGIPVAVGLVLRGLVGIRIEIGDDTTTGKVVERVRNRKEIAETEF